MWQRWLRRRSSQDGAEAARPALTASATSEAARGGSALRSEPQATTSKDRAGRPGRRQSRPPHPVFNEAAFVRAWQAVKANGGGPGTDGVDIARFEADLAGNIGQLLREIHQGTYRPQRVNRVLIPKRDDGLRPLAIWALRDRIAQRAVHDWLEPRCEGQFLACSHGFRPGRSVDTAVAAVLKARDEGLRYVVDADIKECFDSIDGEMLMAKLRDRVNDRKTLQVIELWLRAGMLNADGRVRAAGAAQGGVLSPLLSNIYLHDFDLAMRKREARLVRYADDFVILCRREADAQAALKAAGQALTRLKLEIHPQKTRVVSFDKGFKFLGFFFIRDEHYRL